MGRDELQEMDEFYEYDDYLDLERLANAHLEKYRLKDLDDDDFMRYILKKGDAGMDYVVPGGKFPAYKITKELLTKQKFISKKQRQAILNVYMYHVYGLQPRQSYSSDNY